MFSELQENTQCITLTVGKVKFESFSRTVELLLSNQLVTFVIPLKLL